MSISNSDEQEKLLAKVDRFFKEAKQARDRRKEEFEEAERFYDGKQWKVATERPVDNFCFQIIETEVPILTDSTPGTEIIAHQEDREDDAKILNSAIDYTYDQEDLTLKNSLVLKSALKTGTAFYAPRWDPDREEGEGGTEIRILNWRNFFIDPLANELDDAAYAGVRVQIRVDELARMFPDKEDEIREHVMSADDLFRGMDREALREEKHDFRSDTTSDPKQDIKETTVFEEMYLKDYSMEEIPLEEVEAEIDKEFNEIEQGINPDVGKSEPHGLHIEAHLSQERGILEAIKPELASALGIPISEITEEHEPFIAELFPDVAVSLQVLRDHMRMHEILDEENPGGKRPKFRNNIRYIIKTGKLILFDGEPDIPHGIFPYVPVYCYKDDNSFWGTGELKNIIKPQKSYNEMSFAEYESLMLTANTGWVKDDNSGVEDDDLTNEQGIIITKKQGSIVQRLESGTTSPQLGARRTADREVIEAISGINEATQGRKPGGITAARAIEALSAQAIGRMRLKSRYFELSSMKRLGILIAGIIVNKWSTERQIRIWDSNGKLKRMNFNPENVQDLKYEVRVAPGSTAGFDKQSLFEFYGNLAAQQIITPRQMIELVPDIPGKSKILELLEAQDEQTAIIEQLSAQNEQMTAQLQQVAQSVQGQLEAEGEVPPVEGAPPQGAAPVEGLQ